MSITAEVAEDITARIRRLKEEIDALSAAKAALSTRPTASRTTSRSMPQRRPNGRTSSATTRASSGTRAPSGATRQKVLDLLRETGESLTATDVAQRTGLGRASVSTTMSKLAKSGDIQKTDRGYQIPTQTSII